MFLIFYLKKSNSLYPTGQRAGKSGQRAGEAGQRAGEAGQRAGEAGKWAGEAGQRAGEAGQRAGQDEQWAGEGEQWAGEAWQRAKKYLCNFCNNFWNRSNIFFRSMRKTDLWKKLKLKISCQTPFIVMLISFLFMEDFFHAYCSLWSAHFTIRISM